MKFYKLSFLFYAFLLGFLMQGYAQTVKYVAYFPVPYISHNKLIANKAYFAGADGAKVEINGNLTADSLTTDKDLKISNTNAIAWNIYWLYAGKATSNPSNKGGRFVMVNSSGGTLNITNTPTVIGEVQADNILKLKAVKWNNASQVGFVKSASNQFGSATSSDDGFPIGTTKLCWAPLRLRGSYEYQYYLIAINSGDCPATITY